MKKNIAVVTGGNSSEHVVSLKSADTIENALDKARYNVYRVLIEEERWTVKQQGKSDIPINRDDFSFGQNEAKVRFDCALVAIHGTPGEDGLLQGYFEMLKIPYTTCDVLVSSLTFNKWACKKYLSDTTVAMAKAILIRKGDKINAETAIRRLGLPLFVKPNEGGSSFGISKVKSVNDMQKAIDEALKEDVNVIVEEFISGVELTCGLMRANSELLVFPITEIVSKKEFFDYEAKYTPGMSDEITPARISPELTKRVEDCSCLIYERLGCKGIVRVDYIYNKEKDMLYFLEVNTVPGMTANSLVPKQVKEMGKEFGEILDLLIEESIK
ncbi:MAG: D-alanine--D-alanine ligase [Prevotellaceae bacterium]|jgi:D-alanine-D-alanine ligase|nr:D-alanine--D-alanine ligase [Prevotellaceae bacterium]